MPDAPHPWVDGLTFAEVLRQTAERHAERDALVFPRLNHRRTFAEFHTDVRQAARALMALGIRRGEHVGIWATNRPQWVILQFAAAEIGAVLVNVNPAYRAHELRYVLQQADITTLLLTDRYKTSNYFDILAEVCPELEYYPDGVLRSADCPRLRHVVSIQEAKRPGIMAWSEFLTRADAASEGDLDRRGREIGPEDVVNIQYTSGTTGFPKGAMLTHRNLLMNAFYIGQRMAFSEQDRLCIPVPFYHCFGCVLGTLTCVIYGAAMVVPAESFDPLATLQAVQDERCTALYGVPTMLIAELSHPRFGEFDLRSLRTGVMAGSPCPIEVMRRRRRAHGRPADDHRLRADRGVADHHPDRDDRRPGTSRGHRRPAAFPAWRCGLSAPGSLEPLPPGQQGELIARGHGIMRGYYNKPAETAAAITPDGWLHSGDLALETADGYYRITGRIKDMIIRGGENIYPREIEEYLFTHPAILDVQVVGLPDACYGEEVCAWLRLRPGATVTEEEVRGFCRGQIAHYKVPRYVMFVEEYPTTVTGKVQKYRLRELGIERFGLGKAATVETA